MERMKIVKDGRLIEPGPACRKLNPQLFGAGGSCEAEAMTTTPDVIKPSRRIRQNPKPLSNRLETEFGDYLHSVNWAGNRIYEQAITVRLANGLRYTPDWIVFRHGSVPWCYEVKGEKMWDDSIAKIKMAASKYREWKWVLVWKEGSEWKFQYVLP